MSQKFKFQSNLTTIMGVLHDDLGTFLIIMCSVLLRMKNISGKSCRRNQNTNSMFINIFPKIVPLMR